jgi:hypothetical protein
VGDYRFRADLNGVQLWSGDGNTCSVPGCTAAAVTTRAVPSEPAAVTIYYTYDPLYWLTGAEYSDGTYIQCAYDPVGKRLMQDNRFHGITTNTDYLYDAANRLTNVNDQAYTWDANGNLLDDGLCRFTVVYWLFTV